MDKNNLYRVKFNSNMVDGKVNSPCFIIANSESEALKMFINMVKPNRKINNIKIKLICDMDTIINND